MPAGIPVFQDVVEAHDRIRDYVHRTPVLTSISLNEMFSAALFIKCENLQKVGAFKFIVFAEAEADGQANQPVDDCTGDQGIDYRQQTAC